MAVENIRPIHRPAAEITPIRPGIPVPPAQPLPFGFPIDNISYLTPPVVLAPLAPSFELAHPLPRPEWLPEKLHPAGPTAKHESHHVLLGWLRDIPIEAVSVVPGPGYRGITIFSGNLRHRPHDLQVIAGGGAVDPIGGLKAEGFGHRLIPGSDLHTVNSASPSTGKSEEQIIEEAANQLKLIPDLARQLVADAIETKQLIQGSLKINELIAYAMDFAKRRGQTEYEAVPVVEETIESICEKERFDASLARGEKTILITPEQGPARLIVIEEKDDPFALDEKEETENEEDEEKQKEVLRVDGHPTVVFNEKKHKRKRFSLN